MDYIKNICWCNSSHWDNKIFNCNIIVSISSYKEEDKEDFEKMTKLVEVFNKDTYDNIIRAAESIASEDPEKFKDYLSSIKSNKKTGFVKIRVFNTEVLKWLDDNILDIKNKKSWCVGSNDYNLSDSGSLSVFFQRRKDAMLFIKTFSKWKKPINYCQYFTDVRKTLDIKTLKYKKK